MDWSLFCGESLLGRIIFLSLWPVCFSHLQQLMLWFSCVSAGLIWCSVLVPRFPMWSSAACGNFCCFRSVMAGIFDFCLVCTEWEIADAAASFRQACRSKMCWQLPAPSTLVVSSDRRASCTMDRLPHRSFVGCCKWTGDAHNSNYIIRDVQSERTAPQAGRRCPAPCWRCDRRSELVR